ncbi:MAG: hypothetical protein WBS33_03865 [Verrucomicrobiia bacterium]
MNEVICGGRVPFSNMPAWDQFAVGINGNPRPSVADAFITLKTLWDIRLLAIGECPNLVHLNNLAWQVPHDFVAVCGACLPDFNLQSGDGFFGKTRHALRGSQRATFNKAVDYLGSFRRR